MLKQFKLLEDHTDIADAKSPSGSIRHADNVGSLYMDGPVIRQKTSSQKIEKRCFACTARTDYGNLLRFFYTEDRQPQKEIPVAITELQVPYFNCLLTHPVRVSVKLLSLLYFISPLSTLE